MSQGARTPEQLETLLEDVFLVRDCERLAGLFEDGSVLSGDDGRIEARGGSQIARLLAELWQRDVAYLADPRRVLQARDLALVVNPKGVNVVRRSADLSWRYAIALLGTAPDDFHAIHHDKGGRAR